MSRSLNIGDDAPDFRAVVVGGGYEEGCEVSLRELRGKPVVLYFYPRDDTPGCTVQACGLRDAWKDIKDRATLFGVSTDAPKSHRKFIDKFDLPFPLLSDSEKKIVQDYGVWVEKRFMGKKHMGIERTTFVVGGDGRISAILRKVKPEEHLDLLKDALAPNR
jgi:peroxiredoxin Q/BCP